MRLTLIVLGAAGLSLGGCGGNAPANDAAGGNGVNTAAPVNAAASAAEEPPALSLDQARLEAACIPTSERQVPIQQLAPPRRAALNTCLNTETVRQLAPRLPIRIDSNTQLDRAAVEGVSLVYRYRISRRLAELPPGTPDRLEAHTRTNACAGEDVRQIIALGGAQVYRWVDRDEAVIREVRVDSCPEQGSRS